MPSSFEMDPHTTQTGLTNDNSERVRTSALGVPLPPTADQYTAPFFTKATALLEAKALEVSARTAAAEAATAATIADVETTEAANADSLRT